MSGVYIKGMEMPDFGERIIILTSSGYVEDVSGTVIQGAEAVPVKAPHGRLIDADALMNEFEKAQRTMQQHGREYSCSFMSSSQELSTEWYCVEDMLDNAPTILEAEVDE